MGWSSPKSWGGGSGWRQGAALTTLLPVGSRMAAIGDSIYSPQYRSTLMERVQSRGVAYWPKNANKAVPSRKITGSGGIDDQFATDMAGLNPAIITMDGGTNDIGTATAAAIIAAYNSIIGKCRVIGAKMVISPILPRKTGAFNSSQENDRQTINAFIATLAGQSDISLVDISFFNGDTMTMNDGFGVHPTSDGAILYGQKRRDALAKFLATGDILFGTANDPLNLVTNGFMSGTSGTFANGASGTLPTGYKVDGYASAAGPVISANVSKTDPNGGKWTELVVSGTTPAGSSQWSVDLQYQYQTLASTVPTGTFLEALYEFEVDAGAVGFTGHDVNWTLTQPGFAGNSGSVGTLGNSLQSGDSTPTLAWSGARRSDPGQATATVGIINALLRLYFNTPANAGQIAATLRIGRFGLRVVNAP